MLELIIIHGGGSDIWMTQSFLFFFSFLSHFDLVHGDRMKDTLILPKSQTQKL